MKGSETMLRHLKKFLSRQVSTPTAQSLEAAFMRILHILQEASA